MWVLSPCCYLFVVILCPLMYSVSLVSFCIPFMIFWFLFWSAACFVLCILVLSSHWHLFFTYDITWLDVWLFLFLFLHGVYVVGIMGYFLVGGVFFFCLCTTTYVCISYDPYNVYPFTFFIFSLHVIFCVPIS